MSKLDTFSQLQEAIAERSSGSNFSGTRIPFLSVAPGKTRLLFLSDFEDETSGIPDVSLYKYYSVPGGEGLTLNGSRTFEIAYKKGDPIHEVYSNFKKREGKEVRPEYFALKGYAYVVNLTGLKAVRFYEENGKMPTRKDFGGDINETKAAKTYIDQYVDIKDKYEKKRAESDDDLPEFVYHGVFIYNFPVSITKALGSFVDALKDDGVDPDEISLKEYVFALGKEGVGKNTSYSFNPDYPASEVNQELLEETYEFLEDNELSDFKGLIDRKRNKSEDEELEEEYKVSNVSADDWDD